jgi:uroporphyrin-III C-methyltransferase/precorrin-2 dehydrogenase/sirohydrochlorin ferrochelatase
MIPSRYGQLAGLLRAARERSRAAIPDARRRRRFLDAALDGPIGEWAMLGETARAEAALDEALRRAAEDEAPRGEVYLVGAGPGDPDLLTFRALRLIQKAEVVLYDRLADPRIVALARREAERIYVGKRRDEHVLPQEEIGDLLVRLATEGKRVLRLKGGDPFLFGRGGEEIEKLAEHRIPFQICPGITAAIGCAAYAGIPLTHRDHAQSCVFVTASGRSGAVDHDWRALVRPGQTVAIYMGLTRLASLTAAMIAQGADPDLPAAIVDNGTRANQRVVTGTIADLTEKSRAAGLKGPTIVIVGSVVTLREKFAWYEGADVAPREGGQG